MAEENMNQGSVKISEEVIAGIASLAACEVEGVSKMASKTISSAKDIIANFKQDAKGVSINNTDGVINFALNIVVDYGVKMQDVAEKVQTAVREAVENMTGLKVGNVNVLIVGMAAEKKEEAIEE